MREELDRARDGTLANTAEAIRQLGEEERQARADGDYETADLRREQREVLVSFGQRLAQLDGRKMTQDRIIKWTALIRAHRATGKARPSLFDVADKMGWNSEQPLRDYCRDLGIKNWHDAHPIVAAARDPLCARGF